MKKFLVAILTLIVSATVLLSGCFSTYVVDVVQTEGGYVLIYSDGTQKVVEDSSGTNLSITDLLEATNEERVKNGESELTLEEFLRDYLSYTSENLEQQTSLQTSINKSLLSGVSLVVGFRSGREFSYINGSGVIYDLDKENGTAYIVTNAHMVYSSSGAGDGYSDDIYAFLYGQDVAGANWGFDNYGNWVDTEYQMKAEIVGVCKNYDLAVIKVSNSDVLKKSSAIAATFSDAEEVYVGETVYAVGNADGEALGATVGVISKDSVEVYLDLEGNENSNDYITLRTLRTDAAINGGNSGGALFNANGEIVGMVNSKNDDSDIDNMGYAIPASLAKRVVKSMIDNYNGTENHYVYKSLLGIYLEATATTVSYNADKCVTEIKETVSVDEFASATSKWIGKLQAGDLLKAVRILDTNNEVVDSVDVNRMYSVSEVLHSVRAGYTVEIDIYREGENKTISAKYSASDLVKVY